MDSLPGALSDWPWLLWNVQWLGKLLIASIGLIGYLDHICIHVGPPEVLASKLLHGVFAWVQRVKLGKDTQAQRVTWMLKEKHPKK